MGRPSEAKEKLLQVALHQIWEQSYGAVSVDQICEKAQVKKGSFYHFFTSKSELAVAAYEEYWRVCQPRIEEIFARTSSPLQRIADYCQMVVTSQKRRLRETGRVLGCPYASVGVELSAQNEKVREKTAEMLDRTCEYLEGALRDARDAGLIAERDPKRAAQSVNGFIIGMLVQARIKNDFRSLAELSVSVMQLIGVKSVVSQRGCASATIELVPQVGV